MLACACSTDVDMLSIMIVRLSSAVHVPIGTDIDRSPTAGSVSKLLNYMMYSVCRPKKRSLMNMSTLETSLTIA